MYLFFNIQYIPPKYTGKVNTEENNTNLIETCQFIVSCGTINDCSGVKTFIKQYNTWETQRVWWHDM